MGDHPRSPALTGHSDSSEWQLGPAPAASSVQPDSSDVSTTTVIMLVTSIPNWVVIIVVQLCLVGCSADYFWDGNEWKWQVSGRQHTFKFC